MRSHNKTAAILGGAVSGLAAAHKLNKIEEIQDICVFERQHYDKKRVNCGEAINNESLIPLETTSENGFVNNIDGYQLQVYSGTNRGPEEEPLGVSNLQCDAGYISDRDIVERQWAASLSANGVTFETGNSVSADKYWEILNEYDYIIDATGQPSLTSKVRDTSHEYTGDMIALNATVEGNFQEYANRPRIFFEGYVGYSWSFPKSNHRANVGIGWAGDQRPNNYMDALEAAAERNDFPVPPRDAVNIYTIPRGPSLHPKQVHISKDNVFLVGDAAGIANRYQGEGICQGIRSAYLLGDLIAAGKESTYPDRLYESMKAEYLLAHLMRGVWVEYEDPKLLAAVAEAVEGLTIEEITRHPSAVIARVLKNPIIAVRLAINSGMVRRIVDGYTGSWEYNSSVIYN